jgi:mannosyl-oligosaccharide alpha-1,2-mannosidase
MKDELAPLSGGFRNTFGGWAATLVDSLDTLHMMGLLDEFNHAVSAIGSIDFSRSDESTLNIFETTIRYL